MDEIETKSTYIVAFIDILGFKNIVSDYFSSKNKQSFITLEKALQASEEFAIDFSRNHLKQFNIDVLYKQFSDCVSISIPINGKTGDDFLGIFGAFINIVRLYQYILFDNNILVRGGISIGQHIENDNMIFSEALIQAYKFESEKAIYPRILIDMQLIALVDSILKEKPESYNQFYTLYGWKLITDWDNEIFITPFGLIQEAKLSYADTKGDDQLRAELSNSSRFVKEEVNVTDIRNAVKNMDENDKMNNWLERTKKYLTDNSDIKTEIMLKHKWLQQFIRWSINNEDSEIKFQQYYKKPQEKGQ